MDQHVIEVALADLAFGAIRYYASIDSTNDEAARWADQDAPDLALVIADEQTAGRGRAGRHWYTPPGSALAFSLVLYPQARDINLIQHITAVGALAVQTVLQEGYMLPSLIKWPNDVLIEGLKVAGVLAEAHWMGDELKYIILGIGINIAPPSMSWTSDMASKMDTPVTCMQDATGNDVDRLEVLHKVLKELLYWRTIQGTMDLINAWETRLAFRDEWVSIYEDNPNFYNAGKPIMQKGQILGLAENGNLILRSPDGDIFTIASGEVQIRQILK